MPPRLKVRLNSRFTTSVLALALSDPLFESRDGFIMSKSDTKERNVQS